jgi:hypothetical protein
LREQSSHEEPQSRSQLTSTCRTPLSRPPDTRRLHTTIRTCVVRAPARSTAHFRASAQSSRDAEAVAHSSHAQTCMPTRTRGNQAALGLSACPRAPLHAAEGALLRLRAFDASLLLLAHRRVPTIAMSSAPIPRREGSSICPHWAAGHSIPMSSRCRHTVGGPPRAPLYMRERHGCLSARLRSYTSRSRSLQTLYPPGNNPSVVHALSQEGVLHLLRRSPFTRAPAGCTSLPASAAGRAAAGRPC